MHLDYTENIGKRVMKISGKPFKSGLEYNTVKGVINHPFINVPSYTFEEDESYIEAKKCIVEGNEPTEEESEMIKNCTLKVGDYVRKGNYGLFPNGVPVMTIKNIDRSKRRAIIINGIMFNTTLPIQLNLEERNELLHEWNAFSCIIHPTEDTPFSCVREDNGNAKVPLSLSIIREVLWTYTKRFPECTFHAYKCDKCKKYHIGKPKRVNIEENLLEI